jgi:hypothetical protein
VEPELISARGRDMATCFSGEAVGVDLLMRNGCTWRTILSVPRWCKWVVLVVLVEVDECLVTSGAHTVVLSIVLRRQTGAGVVVECALDRAEAQRRLLGVEKINAVNSR